MIQNVIGHRRVIVFALIAVTAILGGFVTEAIAHGVTTGDKRYIQEVSGVLPTRHTN